MLEISCKRMFVAILAISLLITLGCTGQQETGSQEEEKIHMAVSDQTSQYDTETIPKFV